MKQKLSGRTIYCIHPYEVEQITTIGGTKNPDINKIASIEPDIVIANKEENKKYDVNLLRAMNIKVITTNAETVKDAVEEVFYLETVLTQKSTKSSKLIRNLNNLQPLSTSFSFLYLVWKDPIMVAGNQTYISDFVEQIGGNNSIHSEYSSKRYPKVSIELLNNLNPDFIFLPDEPYSFSQSDIAFFKKRIENAHILPIDGKLASWYGLDIYQNLQLLKKEVEKLACENDL